ncbi:MAG: PASTA domain-containing protein, partial [Candidatus Hydrogenedens sp.]
GEGEGEGTGEGEIFVTIPGVVGMTEQQAKNTLEGVGLNRIRTTYNCSNTVAQGNVLSQIPSSGDVISSRTYIQLTVSSGLCPGVLVPDVVGRSEQQANEAIQIADLHVKVERECNNYVAMGQVIRQSPIAYSGVNRGAEVTIWVSTGQCSGNTYITVPDVIGQNITSAIGQIQSTGLLTRTVMQYSDTVSQNVVMGQSPVGGSSVLNGTTVELIVSNGPDPAGTKISTPHGLQVFSGIDHVYLIWEPNVERNLAGYQLERSETRNGPWITVSSNIITGTNYTDNEVDTSRAWYYRLIAIATNQQQSDPTEPVKAEPGKLRVWIPTIDWIPEGSGDTIQIPININSVRGLEPYTIDINVSYNNTVLELVEVQKTVVTRNLEVVSDTRTQGVIKFHAGPRVDNEKKVLYGEGHLFDMVFRVRQNTVAGSCAQDTDLKLQKVIIKDTQQKELPVELVHGQLNVLEENPDTNCISSRCIYGDMDTDGYIGMSDTIVFLRKIVRKAGIVDLECDKRRGDFNGDGILDCADVSLLLRKLAGLPINPSSTVIGEKALLETENNRTVEIVVDNLTPDSNNEYRTGIELSSLLGVAGMDLLLTYDEGINFYGLNMADIASNFKKDTEVGEGYLKVSISSEKPITTKEKGRIIQIKFKPTTMTSKKINIQIREVKIKGEFGDDLSWYGVINAKGASITITGVEQFINDLKTNFDLVDTNKDGKVSYEEAVARYSTLSRDTFDSADTNKDGYIDKAEAGIVVSEGTLEGTQEGNPEGIVEGNVEGTREGEGEGQNTGICGCNHKSRDGDNWLKYLLDFVLMGMLLLAMSGMRRREHPLDKSDLSNLRF